MIPIVTPDEMGADRRGRARARRGADRAGRRRRGPGAARHAGRRLRAAGRRRRRQGQQRQRRARRGPAPAARACGSRSSTPVDRPPTLPACDLVIDAAYGTGFRGDHGRPPAAGHAGAGGRHPVGVDGLTGGRGPGCLAADRTVTFAALKPGLLLEPGRPGRRVEVADIGLDVSSAPATWVGGGRRARAGCPTRPTTHKWRAAVWVVAGSPGMDGAAALARPGRSAPAAGYVRLSTPGGDGARAARPIEVVRTDLPATGWAAEVVDGLDRFAALVVGNGLGTSDETAPQVRRLVAAAGSPGEADGDLTTVVVDADGLTALGTTADALVGRHVVLTPHDGEFARLAGRRSGPDRLAAARDLAGGLGCVVLLKGARPWSPTPTAGAGDDHRRRPPGHRRHRRRARRDHRRPGRLGPRSVPGRGGRRVPPRSGRRPRLAPRPRRRRPRGPAARVLDRLGAASTTPDRPGT